MWATYCQHPIRRSSLSRLTTDGGKAVSCLQREALRMRNRPHRIAKDSHRALNRGQRHGNRRPRKANRSHRRANSLQKFANGPHRSANQAQRFANARPRNGNQGQRIANVRQFGSNKHHFRLKALQMASGASTAPDPSRPVPAFRASRAFRRLSLPAVPQDRGRVRVGGRGRSATTSHL